MKNLNHETISYIAECTDNNYHTEALITLADSMNAQKYVESLKRLNSEHIKKGFLTSELDHKRRKITRVLFSNAEAYFQNYQEIYKAF